VHDISLGVGERIINEITEELLKCWKDPVPDKSLVIYTTCKTLQGYVWNQHSNRLQRSMETIYIDGPTKDKLVTQLEKFTKSSALYDKYGVTWKRVHLFHGPPGSGKTSTILALASRFNKNIAKLTLTPQLNSQEIENLFKSIPDNTWLLLEDVDALFTERTANTSVDFSTLLNCMDGLTTKRGLVLFMTTNHKTKLDSAFIRPGRVDLDIEFKLPGKDELRKALNVLGSEYTHEHEEFLEKHATDMTIPSLQKYLFECVMDEKKTILQ
jgi:SpoVK/Ycf46/Vps4 family AAA+-type ATPase